MHGCALKPTPQAQPAASTFAVIMDGLYERLSAARKAEGPDLCCHAGRTVKLLTGQRAGVWGLSAPQPGEGRQDLSLADIGVCITLKSWHAWLGQASPSTLDLTTT